MDGFVINKGLKTFEVKDPDGTVTGTVQFNPSDLGLPGRWKTAENAIREIANRPVDKPEDLSEMDQAIKAQVDYAFGSPVSAVFFQGVSSLAICDDGRLVFENVLDAVAPIIQSAQAKSIKESNARIESRTAKYQNTTAGLSPEQK